MATAFQNRLVGTIIIVALAVIFLPEILDGEKRHSQDRFESIPERPPMKTFSNSEEFPFEEVRDAVTREVEIVQEQALDDTPDQSINAVDVPETQTQEVAVDNISGSSQTVMEPKKEQVQAGWVVQLGSFKHSKNVKDLLRKLEQAGYRAFTRPVSTSSGTLTKVFVGPDLDEAKLQNAIPHLKEVTGLQGRLTPFTVD
ncbi:SPOR domain-containing protein [Planctobacterium marinum]|uniref:Cell division protein DedD n=1 Tax=Planctobacterium marinum TaxID=1631968 RepID=A0AA48KVD8_9ALTE|nr:cell division protein DedD [Planctobacterium marinum]